ncbi:hypothetical protein BaRGS_00025611, partial [Batillaria attramentaria]
MFRLDLRRRQSPDDVILRAQTDQRGCLPNEFQCNNTHCIDIIKRCDLKDDCEAGNDEENCETFPCPPTHLKCENHFCVPKDLACDFVDDCTDNSDEKDCKPRKCFDTEFQCANLECVTMTHICDGHFDCKDHSDELPESCENPSFPYSLVRRVSSSRRGLDERHFKCPSGLYITDKLVCDGWPDCFFTHADEANCGECNPDTQFTCQSGRCISNKAKCDGYCDCTNSCEDEDGCTEYGCGLGRGYMCRRFQHCLKPDMVCDGENDCKNTIIGMDEYFCANSTLCADPAPDTVLCRSGQCIPGSLRCDHWMDCLDGADEEGCVCVLFYHRVSVMRAR